MHLGSLNTLSRFVQQVTVSPFSKSSVTRSVTLKAVTACLDAGATECTIATKAVPRHSILTCSFGFGIRFTYSLWPQYKDPNLLAFSAPPRGYPPLLRRFRP